MSIFRNLLILIFFLNVSTSFAQEILYFDYFNNKVKKKDAYYSREEVYSEDQTKATVKEIYYSGKAKSFKKIIRNANGDLIASVTEWYENGNPKSTFNLVNNMVNGDLNYYRETGGLYFRKTFAKDSLIGTAFFEEDGTEYKPMEDSQSGPKHDSTYKPKEVMPEFQGGGAAMYKFIQRNLIYPQISARAEHQGRVYITFIIDEFGSIKFPIIAKGVDMFIDAEALRVILLMPKWNPGTIDGKPIRVKYTMPVKFALN
jgi:TonB family protein